MIFEKQKLINTSNQTDQILWIDHHVVTEQFQVLSESFVYLKERIK